VGRPSIAPERLLRSLQSQAFYSVRGEGMLIEQLRYNLFVSVVCADGEMEMDEMFSNHAVYSKKRECLPNEEIAE